MAGTIMPSPWFTGLDDDGVSVVGGRLYTYAAGTSTPLATFTDVNLQVPNSHPIILDGGGRAVVYLSAASYKFVLKDENDVTIKSQDNIVATAPFSVDLDIAGVAGLNLPAGAVAYLATTSDGGAIPGRWYLTDADFDYASSLAQVIALVPVAIIAGNTGAFRLQGRTNVPGPLTIGAVYYVSSVPGGLVTPAPVGNPPFKRVVGVADSLTTIVSASGFIGGSVVGGDLNVAGNLTVGGTITSIGNITTSASLNIGQHIVFAGGGIEHDIRTNTVDGADTGSVSLIGGGARSADRGAWIDVFGNESNNGGIALYAGQPAGVIAMFASNVPTVDPDVRFGVHPSGSLVVGGTTYDTGIAGAMFFAPRGATPAGGATWTVVKPGAIQLFNVGMGTETAIGFFNDNGTVGTIQTSGASTAYNTASDAMLKDDCGVVTETTVLAGLQVHDFTWKVDGSPGRGLFAQEAITVAPKAVTVGDGERPWMMDYSKLVPDLIAGWQQHHAFLLSLLERLERIESRRDEPS